MVLQHSQEFISRHSSHCLDAVHLQRQQYNDALSNTLAQTFKKLTSLQNGETSYFYLRKQNASCVLAIVWASVHPSVCHTRDLYQNNAS